jgi:two-component system chemotaxis sensor kinase CheA
MDQIDEVTKEFLLESYENLDQLDRDFVSMESDPNALDKLGNIFRTIHTIKGTCGCLGFNKLESIAHVGENLLSRLRDGELLIDTEITTALLRLVDAIREILNSIESTRAEGDTDYSAIRAVLVRLNERPSRSKQAPDAPAVDPAADLMANYVAGPEAVEGPVTEPAGGVSAPEPAAEPAHEGPTTARVHEAAASATPSAAVETGYEGPERRVPAESIATNAIRVDVGLLDKVMNLVGELVLARNQVLQFTASQKDPSFLRTAQRLNLITTELQEGVMKTRMQPIGSLWDKFPRIVRDVSNTCGKKVRIEMEGRDTELDKTIIEAIKDPLTHVIRNSVDHGVESPEKRREAGKNEEGRLFMRAFHEGGQVIIEISDDGKGINPEIVKRKAVEKGLITADQSARMTERDAINLIFLPGFSTAEKITNTSGRGVGMDVVKTNVERIGGTVDVKSKVGEGTSLRIKIPLTLAIIPALIVTSGGERFAIPQVSLLELVRLEDQEKQIELINDTPVYRLRGNLLPLVYLNRELKIERAPVKGAPTVANIVVLRGGERQFGLVVDQINDTEEIVVKPLGKQLKGLTVFAGATIMGDGKVALILDVMGLAQRANVTCHTTEASRAAAETGKAAATDLQTLLLFNLRSEQRMAIPLSVVARLEEFPSAAIENAGCHPVVQYRGQIMPIIDVAKVLGDRRAKPRHAKPKGEQHDTGKLQVIVYAHRGRNVGLRVERILDVIQERVQLQNTAARPGVLGTAILKEKITEMLDIDTMVSRTLETIAAAALKEAA